MSLYNTFLTLVQYIALEREEHTVALERGAWELLTGSEKRGHFTQTKKIEFFMLIKSYNLSQLSAKILEGKTDTAKFQQSQFRLI